MNTENLDKENILGAPYDPELAKQISQDASSNLKSFVDNIDWDNLLTNKEPIVENNVDFAPDNGDFAPYGVECNGWSVFGSKTDEDKMSLTKFGQKTRYIIVYQLGSVHKIDKFIVFSGWDEVVYFNTITNRVSKRNLR